MVHLPIHLAREAQRCGPVQYHWMYPFERFMKVLKGYVRNRARLEGCIAECCLAEECMRFCGGYMNQLGLVGTRQCHNKDMGDETILGGRPFTGGVLIVMSNNMLQIAHYYVLYNTVKVKQYFEMHITELKVLDQRLNHPRNKSLLQKQHKETFCAWLSDKSSKQASKRAKKDQIVIKAALKDDDGELIVSSDDSESSSSPFSSPTSQPHSPPKKKKRGPTKINFIPPMDGKCLKVRFNERGQPVGKTSNRLVSFIGCLKISENFQKIRDTQTMPHTTGRGGLAHLEDKMGVNKMDEFEALALELHHQE
ncbi:hypothetical protein EZV62_004576 [Acer yangbiense]|uniref:DUF4218 domain-containing protein n=1 Tax=Acer yangbiense TaxID=1000413 RepID=A0A5C7IKA4_9ROSI|nr:hypothetical protein EZV62_004576 [Acer yangbiense]